MICTIASIAFYTCSSQHYLLLYRCGIQALASSSAALFSLYPIKRFDVKSYHLIFLFNLNFKLNH
jgi:hypothetical protein